jgi:ubiquinone/menaquinone biosynthesis C-methylase UbiE
MAKEQYPLVEKIYRKFTRLVSRPQERGIYSAGYWMGKVRKNTVALCASDAGDVLEIGCGDGLFLSELAMVNQQAHLFGIDNLPERLAGAEERLKHYGLKGIQLYLGDAQHMPFPNDHFGTVVCINLLLNLPTLDVVRAFMKEMRRVTSTGGRIIFDIRNAANPLLAWKYRLAPLYDHTIKNLPLRAYRLRDIEEVLSEMGLSVRNKTAIGFPWTALAPVILIEAENK